MEVQKLVSDECTCRSCQQPLPGIVPPEPVQQVLPGIPAAMPANKRFRAAGKQVMCDDVHYGDMVDENAANCAADALNGADEQESWSTIVAQIR